MTVSTVTTFGGTKQRCTFLMPTTFRLPFTTFSIGLRTVPQYWLGPNGP